MVVNRVTERLTLVGLLRLATLSNCGDVLRAFATASTWKHSSVHQGNDLGYGKNAKDWIIRSQVLRILKDLWMQFTD